MHRSIGRVLLLGILALTLSLADQSLARAQYGWWDGWYPGAYSYGVGYYPSYGTGYYPSYGWGGYSSYYWPSSYYVGYGSYSMWPSWGGCGSCGSCRSCGSCGGSWCGSGCGTCGTSGCCGLGGCGSCGCGSACGSGCGLACAPDCGCSGGCGTAIAGAGCGSLAPATPPGAKPKPVPDSGFVPRTYDPDAPQPGERTPKPAPTPGPAGAGNPAGPAAATDPDSGAARYSRSKSAAPAQPPKDFDAPTIKPAPTNPPAGGVPKDDLPFGTNEAKKPLVPVPQRGDKRAPISPPDDAGSPDAKDTKKPSAEKKGEFRGPALTLEDRATWHLAGVSRPLFGRIANRPAPIPERLNSSTGDWAVFTADEAKVVRR